MDGLKINKKNKLMERWITEDEIMHRIRNHPDLTKDDKKDFYFDIQMLYTSKKGQEKLDKPIIKNQERNKIKKCSPALIVDVVVKELD
jgi:hypothetical protein